MRRSEPGPDFVCIGAQKAGTTWLYRQLEDQATYWLPPVKELHYFNTARPHPELASAEDHTHVPWRAFRPSGPVEVLRQARWFFRYWRRKDTEDWYYSLFPQSWIDGRLAGDITPAYSTLDADGVRFARRVLKPGCKIVLLVRNPIERAWSAVKMVFRWRSESVAEADEARLLQHLAWPSQTLRGDYLRIIPLWSNAFGADFQTFRYDDLVSRPVDLLHDIAAFIGAPVDVSRAAPHKRANRDPERAPMPQRIREILVARYADEIRELDRHLPGVADRWLSGQGDGPVPSS